MTRWRVTVALMIPEPVLSELNVLRRALADGRFERAAPHLTLVPPLNIHGHEALAAALRVLRAATTGLAGPLVLDLGPVASFLPETPTIHLLVGGDVAGVEALRGAVSRGPLARSIDRAFVAHVTLVARAEPHLIEAARTALAGYRATTTIERIDLLVEHAGPDGRAWQTLADVAWDGVRVVGRGGLEVELTTSATIDPEARSVFGGADLPAQDPGLVITARREGRVVGLAGPGHAHVVADAEGHGIDDLLAAELAWRLSR